MEQARERCKSEKLTMTMQFLLYILRTKNRISITPFILYFLCSEIPHKINLDFFLLRTEEVRETFCFRLYTRRPAALTDQKMLTATALRRRSVYQNIDFNQLLQHFKTFQQNHLDVQRAQTQSLQLSKGVKILDLSSDEE